MKRLPELFRKYDAAFSGAMKVYAESKAELEKSDYRADSLTYHNKTVAIKELFDETMMKLKKEALAEIEVIFKETNEKVDAFVVEPTPADFLPTFEAIKVLDNITEAEAEALFKKYKGNYIAARSLSEYLHEKKGFFTLKIPTLDAIKKDLEVDEESAKAFVINYKKNEYMTRVYTSNSPENPWEKEAAKLEDFINGNVLVIAE